MHAAWSSSAAPPFADQELCSTLRLSNASCAACRALLLIREPERSCKTAFYGTQMPRRACAHGRTAQPVQTAQTVQTARTVQTAQKVGAAKSAGH